ncbi:hypothetical protein HDK77DRAFT_257003 [Phyllosticta capitalensis]
MAGKRPRSAAEPERAVDAKRTHLDASSHTSKANTSRSTAPSSYGPAPAPPPVPVTLEETISVLTPEQMKESLVQYAREHRPFKDFLFDNYAAEMNRRVLSFDHLSQKIDNKIDKALRKSGSRQYDVAFDISESIESTVESIVKQALAPPSFCTTRLNAIFTFAEIGEMIADCTETLGRELRKSFQMEENSFTEAFLDLARSFSDAEKPCVLRDVLQTGSTRSTFEQKLVELIKLCDDYCIMPDLADSLDILRGKATENVGSGVGT